MPFTDSHCRQAVRHELLSATIIQNHPVISAWLLDKAGSEEFKDVVVSAVRAHHLKSTMSGDNTPISIYFSELTRDMVSIGASFEFDEFSLDDFPVLEDESPWSSQDIRDKVDCMGVRKTPEQGLQRIEETPLSLAVKAVTILSDVFGSMCLPVTDEKGQLINYTDDLKDENIHTLLNNMVQNSRETIKNCLQQIYVERNRKFHALHREGNVWKRLNSDIWESIELREIQNYVSNELKSMGTDLLLQASCGCGKTLTAELWANPTKNLILTTPTTGTATQIAVDGKKSGINLRLRHSLSAVDLRLTSEDGGIDHDDLNALEKVLAQYGDDMVVSTVDQVLGVLGPDYKAVLWLPFIVNSQIVFDEFHCYDARLNTFHKKFMEWFPRLHCLCMSASITENQKRDCIFARPMMHIKHNDDCPSANAPRYRIHVMRGKPDRDKLYDLYKDNMLWMVNTVREAQKIGSKFKDALVYHARFRYADKFTLREKFVNGFRSGKPVQGICTQVGEMSLDIQARGGMLTELAPPPNLIQRFGRTARDFTDHPEIVDIYIYAPCMVAPYATEDKRDFYFKRWFNWIGQFDEKVVSQKNLEKALDGWKHTNIESVLFERYQDTKRVLRSGDDISAEGLLQADYEHILQVPWKDQAIETMKLEVPFILKKRQTPSKVFRHRFILDENDFIYDERLGLYRPGDIEE